MLEDYALPVITPFKLFELIRQMYAERAGRALYLRDDAPTSKTFSDLRLNLKKSGIIAADKDYGSRLIRILGASDQPAESIVCLADPTCYISHLSAMQRWGITNRTPNTLIVTRPDRAAGVRILKEVMQEEIGPGMDTPFPLRFIAHPKKVRRRPLSVYQSKAYGHSVRIRGEQAQIATIGQTFLDTIDLPDSCGGMGHVLETWDAHALTYLEDIIAAVNEISSSILVCRAGYILEERLSVRDPRIEAWKDFAQRGSSRRLDPSAPFAPTYSESWMLSLNV